MPHRVSTLVTLTVGFWTLCAPASAQPTELFFSEYIEGSSNNKALEIFNGTAAAVDLAAGGYNVQMHFNGNPVAGLTINLMGTVAAGDVFVLAQSSASAVILAVADQTNGAGWFNGDDAVVLRKGTTIVDVIGQIGFDPGTEWGSGLVSTADNTLRRQLSITAGDPNGGDVFTPASEWTGFAVDTFGGLGCHTAAPICPLPPAEFAEIWEIQGSGLASAFAGMRRRTAGNVVTAVFSDGFYIQDDTPDGDAQTSDGLFVFTATAPTVEVGDEVDVTGTVTEFFSLTELTILEEVIVTMSGRPLPDPIVLDAETPSPDDPSVTQLERYEGMLVRMVDGTVSGPTNQFDEAAVVATPQRAFREPGILFPGLSGLPVWDGNPEIFEIDTSQYAASPRLPIAAGARVTAVGPLTFSFGDYQIVPTALEVTGEPAVVPVRAPSPGEFTVGTQNVLRLFDTVDDPDVDDQVLTPAAYTSRLAKLSLHVRQALRSPDVLAVQEVENLTALEDLASRIAADDPTVVYSAYLLEGNDIGGIDVGFLVRDTVRVDSIEQFGKDDIFEFPPLPPALLNDRPPLLLRGAYIGDGAMFPIVVINVHQRSLSGIEGSSTDAQRVRAKRNEQALRLSQFIDSLQNGESGVKLVVLGDFNAFEFTDGYVDVMGQVTGNLDPAGALLPATDEVSTDLINQTTNLPEPERYTFVFDGNAQSLDHVLTSQSLTSWVRGVQHSRGNADAPVAFGDEPSTSLRAADHDGTVLFVTSDLDSDGVPDNLDLCADTRIPESVPTTQLRVNHYALVDGDGVFDTLAGRNRAPTFTIDDTRGCSCEQILDRTGQAVGQRLFGCSVDTMQRWIAARP